jgi:hypothetical protein
MWICAAARRAPRSPRVHHHHVSGLDLLLCVVRNDLIGEFDAVAEIDVDRLNEVVFLLRGIGSV